MGSLRPFRMYLLMAVVPITMALSLFDANANSIPEERAIQQMLGSIAGHLGAGPADCSDLPLSMNSAATNEKGCPGAVGGMEVHRKNTALAQDMVLVNMNGGNIAVNGNMVKVVYIPMFNMIFER